MKDYLGQELAVGDKIVYITHQNTSSYFQIGVIKKINPKTVSIEGDTYRSPDKIVKVG